MKALIIFLSVLITLHSLILRDAAGNNDHFTGDQHERNLSVSWHLGLLGSYVLPEHVAAANQAKNLHQTKSAFLPSALSGTKNLINVPEPVISPTGFIEYSEVENRVFLLLRNLRL